MFNPPCPECGSKNNTKIFFDGPGKNKNRATRTSCGHKDGFGPDRVKNKYKCKDCGKIFKKKTGSKIVKKFYSLIEKI